MDLRTATKLVLPGDFIASIDLEDAYYLVRIHKKCVKYLRFQFLDRLYEFVCLPFGLNTSPFVFTKLLKPVVNCLRKNGFQSVVYLDDFLCIENSIEKCNANSHETITLLQRLGFLINERKSCLTPSTRCRYLGFIIDSVKFSVALMEEKRSHLSTMIKQFKSNRICSIRDFAQLIGKLIAACPAIEYGYLYTKVLEREKSIALILNDHNYDSKMAIPDYAIPDLDWWGSKIRSSIKQIDSGFFNVTIYTDASTSGWGAVRGYKKAYGFWNNSLKKNHINYLELLTAELALKELAADLEDCKILLRIDNTTAISYINRMGGTKLVIYHNLAKRIWQWAERRRITFFVSYIASKENTEADALSRIKNEDGEWELADSFFNKVIEKFGSAEIDLFAMRENSKCRLFCSWLPDKEAENVDAFTISWYDLKFYAYPPFALILKNLAKIRQDRASGIVVAPNWPNQP